MPSEKNAVFRQKTAFLTIFLLIEKVEFMKIREL